MDDINTIYWRGKPVGVDNGRWVSWFPSAPREAIKAFGRRR